MPSQVVIDTWLHIDSHCFAISWIGPWGKQLEKAYDYAVIQSDEAHNEFSPRSTWGMAQGITAMSQTEDYAEKRVELDRSAGKVLSMTF